MEVRLNEGDCRRILIVEGYSDLLFFAELLEHMGIGELERNDATPVFIKEMGGKANLRTKLDTYLTPQILSEKDAIGIVVDADGDPAAAFASLQAVVQSRCAVSLAEAGTWSSSRPKIGVQVVPSSARTGAIETLVWDAWSTTMTNHEATNCVGAFLDCMARTGRQPANLDKARIGAVLSILHDEDPRLGPGARAQSFDLAHPSLADLRQFLDGLRVT